MPEKEHPAHPATPNPGGTKVAPMDTDPPPEPPPDEPPGPPEDLNK